MTNEIYIDENNKSKTAIDTLNVKDIIAMNNNVVEEFLKKQELRKQNVVNVDEYDIMSEIKKHKLNNVSIEIEKDSEFLEIDTGD